MQTVLKDSHQTYFGTNDAFEFFFVYDLPDGPKLYWQTTRPYTTSSMIFTIHRNEDYGNPDAWKTVINVVDTWTYQDTEIKLSGKERTRLAYKITFRLNNQEISSPVAYLLPQQIGKERILARAIFRRIFTEPKTIPHLSGKLIKRKHVGTKCSCVDSLTGETLNSDCKKCKGTGIINGYWKGFDEYHVICKNPLDSRPVLDPNLLFGTVAPSEVVALGRALPPPTAYDIWIPDNFNRRFYIVNVQVVAELRGFPILVALGMRMAEAGDVIYEVQP